MIQILLATYNGAAYLPQQLDSLLKQTYFDWRILARDDGSTDVTVEILSSFARANPGRLEMIKDADKGLGPRGNFARLLQHATGTYTMFCDQDDVWLPEKIEVTLKKIKELEARFGTETPILVYADLAVVDASLNHIDDSFWNYQNVNPRHNSLNRLLVQTVVGGCTVMINAPLRTLSLPIPSEAIMHDWWLALVARAFGHLDFVPRPTLLYRQHGRNDYGASRFGLGYVWRKLAQFDSLQQVVQASQRQAKVFAEQYQDKLDPNQLRVIETYASLSRQGFWLRRYHLLRYGFFKTGLARNVGMFLRV